MDSIEITYQPSPARTLPAATAGDADDCDSVGDGSTAGDADMEHALADQHNMSSQELEKVKEECKTNKHVKPPYSYIALITMAVLQV